MKHKINLECIEVRLNLIWILIPFFAQFFYGLFYLPTGGADQDATWIAQVTHYKIYHYFTYHDHPGITLGLLISLWLSLLTFFGAHIPQHFLNINCGLSLSALDVLLITRPLSAIISALNILCMSVFVKEVFTSRYRLFRILITASFAIGLIRQSLLVRTENLMLLFLLILTLLIVKLLLEKNHFTRIILAFAIGFFFQLTLITKIQALTLMPSILVLLLIWISKKTPQICHVSNIVKGNFLALTVILPLSTFLSGFFVWKIWYQDHNAQYLSFDICWLLIFISFGNIISLSSYSLSFLSQTSVLLSFIGGIFSIFFLFSGGEYNQDIFKLLNPLVNSSPYLSNVTQKNILERLSFEVPYSIELLVALIPVIFASFQFLFKKINFYELYPYVVCSCTLLIPYQIAKARYENAGFPRYYDAIFFTAITFSLISTFLLNNERKNYSFSKLMLILITLMLILRLGDAYSHILAFTSCPGSTEYPKCHFIQDWRALFNYPGGLHFFCHHE